MQIKLTFNKPAYKMFFEGEECSHLRLRIDNGVAMFQPTNAEAEDTAPLSFRSRGGVEAEIDGRLSDLVVSALNNPQGYPYFLLNRAQGGWIEAKPYGKPGEPPRFQAQIRVWIKDNHNRPMPLHLLQEAKRLDVATFVYEIREAQSVVAEYDREKKAGRPPAEVTEARDKLRLFSEAARDLLPVGEIWKAYGALAQFLGVQPGAAPDDAAMASVNDLPLIASQPSPVPASVAAFMTEPQSTVKAVSRKAATAKDDRVKVVPKAVKVDEEAERLAKENAASLGLSLESPGALPNQKKKEVFRGRRRR